VYGDSDSRGAVSLVRTVDDDGFQTDWVAVISHYDDEDGVTDPGVCELRYVTAVGVSADPGDLGVGGTPLDEVCQGFVDEAVLDEAHVLDPTATVEATAVLYGEFDESLSHVVLVRVVDPVEPTDYV